MHSTRHRMTRRQFLHTRRCQICRPSSSHDAKATPPDKYKVLADVGNWTTNVGYPGHTNAAIAEIFNSGLIGKLMARPPPAS